MFLEDEPDDDDISIHEDELERDGPQEESRLYRPAKSVPIFGIFLDIVMICWIVWFLFRAFFPRGI